MKREGKKQRKHTNTHDLDNNTISLLIIINIILTLKYWLCYAVEPIRSLGLSSVHAVFPSTAVNIRDAMFNGAYISMYSKSKRQSQKNFF